MLTSLSPLDGRYAVDTEALRAFFSEEALIGARIEIEVLYFMELAQEKGVPQVPALSDKQKRYLLSLIHDFSSKEAQAVKTIEGVTRHDVKAVEYYLKQKVTRISGLKDATEFVHFGLTSEDVNNLAYGILIHRALKNVLVPSIDRVRKDLRSMANAWKNTPMLSLTHGQPATPTTVGKEILVFEERLGRQMDLLKTFRMQGKLGGAVGNFSAHRAAYPKVNWEAFRLRFVRKLGLTPLHATTQINPHDDLAELSHLFIRINTILLDCSRDMWMYISRGIFRQKVVAGEVGSSAMPHKVNPIDFENAEGNLGLSSALFGHFAEKLPVSRMQRDLSDSTVQRSIGVAFGYHLLAVKSLQRGFSRISLDRTAVLRELQSHPEVVAEAIQTVLRKHRVTGAYEKLKDLTRGEKVTAVQFRQFIDGLELPKEEKERLKKMVM
jgi:adenylosuccinate lyase